MASTPKRRERLQRLDALLADPLTLGEITSFVAGGKTLAEFTAARDVPYNAVASWIADHEDRQRAYDAAVGLRDAHNKDVVVEQLRQMSTVDLADAIDKETNCYKRVHDMPPNVRKSIASIKVREEYADRTMSEFIASRFAKRLIEELELTEEQIEKLETFTAINLHRVKLGEVIEVKMWDRNKSTETMARSLKQLTDTVDVQGKVTLEHLVSEANKVPA